MNYEHNYYTIFNTESDAFLTKDSEFFHWKINFNNSVVNFDLESVYGHTLLLLGGYIQDDGYFQYSTRLYNLLSPYKGKLLLPIVRDIEIIDFIQAIKV